MYKCIVCGREFLKGQSLRAHLKAHRGQMAEFSVKIPKGLRDDFKELCRAHGVTTCHVVVGLISAAVEGFRRGVVFEWDPRTESARLKSGSNPLVVNFNQNFLGKPRSAWKTPLSPAYAGRALGSLPMMTATDEERKCVVCGAPGVYARYPPAYGHKPKPRWFCEKHPPKRPYMLINPRTLSSHL